MGVLAVDTFFRPDSADTWGTASDGVAVWSHATGTDTLSLVGHDGMVTYSTGLNNIMLCGVATSLPIEGRCRFQCSNATLSTAGIVLRSNSAGTTFYWLVYKFASQKLFVYRVTAGVPTQVTSTLAAADTAHVYRLRFRAVGTAQVRLLGRIWQEGTAEPTGWMVNGVDNSAGKIVTAGRFGLSALPGVAASTVAFDTASYGDMQLGTYHDYTTLQARVLTPQEYTSLGGTISTRSGSTAFLAEDFLCKNFTGVWVVPHATFMALGYERISDPDGSQFYIYSTLGAARTVTVTDQGNDTVLCSDGTVADTATFDTAYTT